MQNMKIFIFFNYFQKFIQLFLTRRGGGSDMIYLKRKNLEKLLK